MCSLPPFFVFWAVCILPVCLWPFACLSIKKYGCLMVKHEQFPSMNISQYGKEKTFWFEPCHFSPKINGKVKE